MSVSPPKHEHPVGSESQLWERHLVESRRLTDGRCVVFFFIISQSRVQISGLLNSTCLLPLLQVINKIVSPHV